jgi:Lon protease-like protein
MPDALLPLFPLQTVVFPRTRLPLHIFEERYKELIGEAIAEKSEFGVVLAKEGGIVNVGCTVMVDEVSKKYPDGRMDIVTSGRRRLELFSLDNEKAYLRGEVEFFDDEDTEAVSADLHSRTLAQYGELVKLGAVQPSAEPDMQDPQLSFQLAQSVTDLDFLSMLLRSRSECERMRELNRFFSTYLPQQREAMRMKGLAPLNGHGQRRIRE